jgi:hypothetical protein
MAVDKDDNLFIADRNNSRVQKFDYNGKFITKFGTEGHNDGQLSYPEGIAIDSSGNVIISDTGNIRIDKFVNKGINADLINDPVKLNIPIDALDTSQSSTSFSDVPSNAWYKSYIDTLVGKGIISGYSDNTFRPGASVTRAEFSKMLALALGWQIKATTSSSFTDVPAGSWASPYIEAAKSHNALTGYPDGKFNPLKFITRAEIATIIARVEGYQPTPASFADTKGHWANGSIGACAKAGILSGYPGGIFKPNGPGSRAEAAKLIAALL